MLFPIEGLTREDFLVRDRFEEITLDLVTLHRQKASAYGDNLTRVERIGVRPSVGVLIRMMDKWSRIENLTRAAVEGASIDTGDESLIDSARDLASYAILLIELLEQGR